MDKFSLANKQNEIQRSASTLKIQRLRKTYDSLIKIEQPKEPAPGDEKDAKEKVIEAVVEVDNPFTEDNCESHISLSVYNQPQMLIQRRPRPMTTQDQLLSRLPGWKKPVVKPEIGPDGEPIPIPDSPVKEEREPLLPDLRNVSEMITKDGVDQERQESLLDVYSIKDRLARDGCPTPLKVIKRAMLMSEEPLRVPSGFQYPNPKVGLMVNPWPKKKKKSKKKKKKR